jgi:hypothetical protein
VDTQTDKHNRQAVQYITRRGKKVKTVNKELEQFLRVHNFGKKVFNDYYGQQGLEGYKADLKRFTEAKNNAKKLLKDLPNITEAEIVKACKDSFCGRLEYDGQFHYTAGQFYDIEVPQAVQSVLINIKVSRE